MVSPRIAFGIQFFTVGAPTECIPSQHPKMCRRNADKVGRDGGEDRTGRQGVTDRGPNRRWEG